MKEVWKDIPGFEGLYQISNYGRLKSFHSDCGGRILSVTNSTGWYLSIILTKDRNRFSKRIHQLVVETFLGIKSTRFIQIHHLDGNRQNNRLDNLSVIASRTHSLVSIKENPGIIRGLKKHNQETRPIPILQFDLEGNFIAEYKNGKAASIATGVCHRNILQVANKTEYNPGLTRRQAGGFIWKFKQEKDVA